ncbi:Alpha/Beta hydrolase protein [Pestalotiopsis sp. NC0098]|nr:Alpha/Beta hydrolase protein [Pestalotiopsis sp. NC0098]
MASKYLAAGMAMLPALTQATCTTRAACSDVHLFLARGTTEGYPGLLGSLTTLVTDAINGSTYENILYPATQEGSTPSYEEGIANGTAQVQAYAQACPDSKLVLLGYSQGAMVVSDMLAGGGDGAGNTLGNYTSPTINPDTLGSQIAAVVLYGDPRHTANQTYNVGDVAATGKYPRTADQITALGKYADRLHDYCDDLDGVCDAAGTNLSAHLAYATIWDTTAATWLEDILA